MATKKTTMTKCPACGKAVSSAAASCPGCGHPVGRQPGAINMKDPVHVVGVIAAALVVLFAVIGMIAGVVMAVAQR